MRCGKQEAPEELLLESSHRGAQAFVALAKDHYVGHGLLMGLFGTSCIFSPVVTYVSRWFDRSRGAAVAMISSGQSLSGALWPILFQTGITEFGWRRTMLVFGLHTLQGSQVRDCRQRIQTFASRRPRVLARY
jgi:hypothetical protein